MKYRFGDCVLDSARFELTVDGELVSVEPKVLDVLLYLVENVGRVVSKVEVLEQVWGDQFVAESALTTRISHARRALGDDGRNQTIIRTVHGRGYEFLLPVDKVDEQSPVQPPPVSVSRVQVPVKALVGREGQMADLDQSLSSGRLLTLVGPAGAGKTHLARHGAGRFGHRFPAGSYFVTLTNVRDGGGVAQAILDGLGRVTQEGGPDATVVQALADTEALVVLDNCEHVLDAVARLLSAVPADAKAAVLATSRRRLGVGGEQVLPMLGLEPDEAVRLLVGLAAGHGAPLDTESPTVRQVCDTLDHLPLALELASARIRALGIDTLARLLDDRMRLLEGSYDVDAHHQTLEGAIASSFDDLDPFHQRTLSRFSRFEGSFDLEAATALATAGIELDEVDAVRHVIDLVERSLIVVEEGTSSTRYRLLESIRLFAEQRLTDEDRSESEQAHAEYFATSATGLAAAMGGAEEAAAAETLTAEWPDLGRAVEWGRHNDRADLAIDPLVALGFHLLWQHRPDGFAWLEQAVEALDPRTGQRPDLGLVRSIGAWMNGDIDRSEQLLDAVEAVGGPTAMSAFVRIHHAMARFDYELLAVSGESAWELANGADGAGLDTEWRLVVAAIRFNCRALRDIADPELPAIEATLDDLTEEVRWPTGQCWSLFAKTTVNTLRMDVAVALEAERQLIQLAARCHAPWFPLAAAGLTAGLRQADEDPVARLQLAAGAVRAAVTAGDLAQVPMYLHAAVVALVAADQSQAAAWVLGLIPEVPGVGSGGELAPGFEAAADQVRATMPKQELEQAMASGKRSTLKETASIIDGAAENAAAAPSQRPS